jgi:hypothetical protein
MRFRFTWIYALPIFLFAIMAAGNPLITVAGAVPNGIIDHQTAGAAARVAEIHLAWKAEGGWLAAQALIALDLAFIPAAFVAFCVGAKSLWGKRARALAGAAFFGGTAAFVTDLTETGAQAWQVFVAGPDDGLAGLAAGMVEPKLAAYVVAVGALLAGAVLARLKT